MKNIMGLRKKLMIKLFRKFLLEKAKVDEDILLHGIGITRNGERVDPINAFSKPHNIFNIFKYVMQKLQK